MRKKLTGILLSLLCLLALTACGGTAQPEEEPIPQELVTALYSYAENDAQQMDMIVRGGMLEEQNFEKVVYDGMQSWSTAIEEIGEVDFTADADNNGTADCFTEKSVTKDEAGNYIVTVGIRGSLKSADLVVTYQADETGNLAGYESIVANVNYTKAELMQQAGLNTLLGMGTTFAVLILLSLIIALFGRILTSAGKKKTEGADKDEKAAAPAGAAPAVTAEVQGGQDELIAVIAAAIAAYRSEAEPQADPNGFVVRRIRRVKRK